MRMCIICQKEVVQGSGALQVKEDPAIRLIRRVKQAAGIARNNDLYVCTADREAHAKRRKDFENNLIFSTVIAGVFVLLLIVLPILSGRLNVLGILGSILLGALLIVVVIFFRYTPAVEEQPSVPSGVSTSSTPSESSGSSAPSASSAPRTSPLSVPSMATPPRASTASASRAKRGRSNA